MYLNIQKHYMKKLEGKQTNMQIALKIDNFRSIKEFILDMFEDWCCEKYAWGINNQF